MSAGWRRLVWSSALLLMTVVAVALVLGLLGGFVLLPQLGALGWVAVGLGFFLAVQLLVFRLFNLRSSADDESEEEPRPPDAEESGDESDWRAWRG